MIWAYILGAIVIVSGLFFSIRFNAPDTEVVNRGSPEIPSEVPMPEPKPTEEGDSTTLSSRVVLDLSNQALISVPKSMFEARTDIEKLDLSHNKLTGSLPAEVRFLKELTNLDLSYNQFTGVPAEIGQLTELEELNLSHNPITGLPYELGNLKKLRVLDLRGTNYSTQDLAIIRASIPGTTILVDK